MLESACQFPPTPPKNCSKIDWNNIDSVDFNLVKNTVKDKELRFFVLC